MSNLEVKKLPPPRPGLVVIVPLRLLPAYMKLYSLEGVDYKEADEILIVKRDIPQPRTGAESGTE